LPHHFHFLSCVPRVLPASGWPLDTGNGEFLDFAAPAWILAAESNSSISHLVRDTEHQEGGRQPMRGPRP
jgi:hypothetical protein